MTIKLFDMKSEIVLIIIEMYIGVCIREKGRLIVCYCYIKMIIEVNLCVFFYFLFGYR